MSVLAVLLLSVSVGVGPLLLLSVLVPVVVVIGGLGLLLDPLGETVAVLHPVGVAPVVVMPVVVIVVGAVMPLDVVDVAEGVGAIADVELPVPERVLGTGRGWGAMGPKPELAPVRWCRAAAGAYTAMSSTFFRLSTVAPKAGSNVENCPPPRQPVNST